jgi:hypothetical protein
MGTIETHLDIALRYSDGDLPRTSIFPLYGTPCPSRSIEQSASADSPLG